MFPILLIVRSILDALQHAGGRPLLVGGAVRDSLLGTISKDIDIEVYGLQAEDIQRALAPFGVVHAVGKSFGVLKLRLPEGYEIDISLPQLRSWNPDGERGSMPIPDPNTTPQQAASRRDFTWNALALTSDGRLLDFYGGQQDLEQGIIRHVSDHSFGDDPLRVLRAMQFAARFSMQLAPETVRICQSLLPAASTLASERIWGEWQKWASLATRPSAGLQVLRETGWLSLYPTLEALIDCPQDPHWHPEGDVWTHTGHVCDVAAHIALRQELSGDERVATLFGALCHDLGKATTTVLGEDGRWRSPGHDKAGVEPARQFLKSIGAPARIMALVLPLVQEHMNAINVQPTERIVRRLAVRLAPATIALWHAVVEADASGRPPAEPADPGAAVAAMAQNMGTATGRPVALLSGRDLLERGIQQGPTIGQVLAQAYEAQIEGVFTSREEALVWLEDWLKNEAAS